jgi:hypothetical protein
MEAGVGHCACMCAATQRGMWCPFVKDLYRLAVASVERTDLLVEILSTLGNIPYDETPRGFTIADIAADSGGAAVATLPYPPPPPPPPPPATCMWQLPPLPRRFNDWLAHAPCSTRVSWLLWLQTW